MEWGMEGQRWSRVKSGGRLVELGLRGKPTWWGWGEPRLEWRKSKNTGRQRVPESNTSKSTIYHVVETGTIWQQMERRPKYLSLWLDELQVCEAGADDQMCCRWERRQLQPSGEATSSLCRAPLKSQKYKNHKNSHTKRPSHNTRNIP